MYVSKYWQISLYSCIVFIGILFNKQTLVDIISSCEVKLFIPFLHVLQIGSVALTTQLFTSQDYPKHANVYDGDTFDFVIVGGGSAGCVLANRLTEVLNWTVMLIEAGDDPPRMTNVPGLSVFVSNVVPNWNHYTVNDGYSSQAHKTNNIRVNFGKMLGGSSVNNFMYYVRGNKLDFDSWASAGNEGWNWDNVTYYFKKSERLNDETIMKSETAHLHNDKGYLGITRPLWKDQVDFYLKAFGENGHDIHEDTNGYKQIGYSPAMFTVDGEKRQSTAAAFLKPIVDRKNLYVLKNTLARKVVFENKKAVGVEVKLPDGKIITVKSSKEVILSAGGINSPQLLMLSGIGPKNHLKEMNIDVIAHSPHVGNNLQDHIMVPIVLSGEKTYRSIFKNFDLSFSQFPSATFLGFVALNKNQTYPDYQITGLPSPAAFFPPILFCSELLLYKDEVCRAIAKQSLRGEYLFALLTALHPKSRGKIRLKHANPEEKPLIYSGYFQNTEDLDNMAKYIEDFISVINTTSMRSIESEVLDMGLENCNGRRFGSRDYWKCYALNLASTQYHVSGTCGMGSVLDGELRVRGVTSLRVADASVMPTITSGNTNAPTIMIAEKAADIIKASYRIGTSDGEL